jgi:chromosome segregation ATPase
MARNTVVTATMEKEETPSVPSMTFEVAYASVLQVATQIQGLLVISQVLEKAAVAEKSILILEARKQELTQEIDTITKENEDIQQRLKAQQQKEEADFQAQILRAKTALEEILNRIRDAELQAQDVEKSARATIAAFQQEVENEKAIKSEELTLLNQQLAEANDKLSSVNNAINILKNKLN